MIPVHTSVRLATYDGESAVELVLIRAGERTTLPSSPIVDQMLKGSAGEHLSSELGEASYLLPSGLQGPRVLVLGLGCTEPSDLKAWSAIGGHLMDAIARHRIGSLLIPRGEDIGGPATLEAMLLGAALQAFRLKPPDHAVKLLYVEARDEQSMSRTEKVSGAINRARAWIATPPNLLTPDVWPEEVREAHEGRGATVHVLDSAALQRIGADALLAVGKGSRYGARLLIVEWRGSPDQKLWDAVLIGKGLTFDSGGLNLKPRPTIAKMKVDMAGGAAVLGALELAAIRRSPSNVIAIVAIAENMVDAASLRPGDVIQSLAGLSIEVGDTDAEGRLVLADAMTYALRTYQPRYLIDAATLTTAIMDVLHEDFAGLYTRDTELAQSLLAAGEEVGERLWPLPLDGAQGYLVQSDIADISNVGKIGYFGRGEGSPTAGAQFLQRFAGRARWAHIDLCGVVWSTRHRPPFAPGPIAFGARLLDRWLQVLERTQ